MSLIYSGYFKGKPSTKKGVPQKFGRDPYCIKDYARTFEVHIFNNRTIYLFQSHNQYKQSKHLLQLDRLIVEVKPTLYYDNPPLPAWHTLSLPSP